MSDVASRMFQWWNRAIAEPSGFTAEGFAPFFTEDARLIVNGRERGSGLDALARRFEQVRAAVDRATVRLPLEQSFGEGDQLFVHYRVDAVVAGQPAFEEAMGFCRLRDDRIALMHVVSREWS